MREKVFQYIRERALLRAGDRVAVAVSGGADSVALLRVLLELRGALGIVLSVAHFNHGLRAEQTVADEAFVAELAKEHDLEYFVGRGDVRDHAFTSKLSLEAAGRELRYGWLGQLAREQRLDVIATAHTLDDQAETVLLKLLRGAGTKGLAGIHPILYLSGAEAPVQAPGGVPEGAPVDRGTRGHGKKDHRKQGEGSTVQGPSLDFAELGHLSTPRIRVVRPLLSLSRVEVEGYLASLDQTWREDESNLDRRFLRNRVRHELLPLLEREYNPNIRRVLSDLAELSRGEEEYWKEQVGLALACRAVEDTAGVHRSSQKQTYPALLPARRGNDCAGLDLRGFDQLPVALQRRLLKAFAESQKLTLDFEHVEKLRRCALGEVSKVELPGGRIAQRAGTALVLRPPPRRAECSYYYRLPIPGEVHVLELELTVRAQIVAGEFTREVAPEELLSLHLLGPELVLRNWAPGDRFWPAHSRSAEKLKRLFLEKRVPAEERARWPVAVRNDEVVWVRGFPAAQLYRWGGEGEAVRIEVLPDRP